MTPSSSLLQWLSTFKLDGNKSAVELDNDAYYNLADGYVCARILNQISPIYFTDRWLSGIKPVPPNGSWRLRVSNLKRILQKIYDYASDLQSHQFKPSAISPDVTVIAQNFDPDQINRLIQLILFCAINCDKKQAYIEMIRDLPTQIKQDIKEAIEELLVKNGEDNIGQNVGDNLNNSTLSNTGDTSSTTTTTNRQFNTSSSSSFSASNVNIINSSPARHISTNFNNNLETLRNTNRRDSAQSDTNRGQQSDISATSYHSENNANKSNNMLTNANNETVDDLKQQLQAALAVNDSKAQACHELEMKLKQLKVERDQLAYENEQLIDRNEKNRKLTETNRRQSSSNINDLKDLTSSVRRDISETPSSDDLARQQNMRLQSEVQRLKEEIIRIETEKEDFRLKSNLLKEDLDRITMRHENLRDKAEQARRLQDELDEHKHISGKVISYEQMIENLVKKNNEMKKELKSFEEKNLSHVQNIVRLEQENQQLLATVNQIEIYRKQLNEAHSKLSEETHRADKAEVELSRLADKLELTRRENEKLFEATNQLMLTTSASKDRQQQSKQNNVVDALGQRMFESVDLKETTTATASTSAKITNDNNDQQDNMINSISSTVIEFKEKIARLEMENQLLEARLNLRPENNKTVLGGLLEESTEKCKKLENENRQARKKIMLLESNLKDLMSLQNQAQTSSSSMANKQQQHGFVLQQQDTSSDNVLALIKRVEDLQRSLYHKDQELREVEAKYKRNIQKAKEVMKALNSNGGSTVGGTGGAAAIGSGVGLHPSFMSSASSFNSNSLDEINLLRQQLRDREERLIKLEREFYEFKKLKEVHERLILSAFYGLTTPMQWKNAEKRLERTTLTSPPNTANSSMNNFSPSGKNSH